MTAALAEQATANCFVVNYAFTQVWLRYIHKISHFGKSFALTQVFFM